MRQRQPIRVGAAQILASRVANIVLPQRAASIFPKLLERQKLRYGENYGMATPPSNGGLSESMTVGPSTRGMKDRQSLNTFDTRADLIRQQSGLQPLTIQQMSPRPGRGSPTGVRDGALAPASMNPRLSATASPAGAETVDDSGWPVTLTQILGSRVLSAEQLQAASYGNVYAMIAAGSKGLSEQNHQEAAYLMQRMILEGYIRGVDIVRDIQKENGGKVPLSIFTFNQGSTIGWGGGGNVQLDANYWNSVDDAGKLALFYHEMGHELLDISGVQEHTNGGIMNPIVMSSSQIKANYTSLMDSFFKLGDSNRFTPTAQNVDVNALLQAHPDWFPSVTGTVTPGGPFGSPTGPTGNVTNISVPPAPVVPLIGSSLTDISAGGTSAAQPASESKTPVAGVLPDMQQLYTFSAGLANQQNRQSPSLQGMAGALAKFQSG